MTTKNLTACIFALAVNAGLSPGQFLTEFSDKLPGYDEWFENYLPEIGESQEEDDDVED